MAGIAVGTLVGGAAFLMVVLKLWLAAAILGGAWLVLMAIGSVLMLRADKDELMARSAENQRWLDTWAQGMAKMSGGWRPRSSSGERHDQSE